ncbi:uncharacterized protein LOC134695989 [Mytilus trossulus]|uniref:uncharacterized protein LOC134695989 n=1 Tax=Mytilus trossulus TaxID=6551 RepID=UPI003003CB74
MRLRNRIILTAVTQYFLITYYLMFVSISTDYWTDDGKNHEGLWKKCLYNTKISSLYNVTCCSSRPFKGHIGAERFFFILQLILDTLCIFPWFVWLFLKKKNYETVFWGIGTNVFNGYLYMIIVLSVYGGKEPNDLGWSFHLLLSVLFLRIPCYSVLCKVLYEEQDNYSVY